MRHFRPELIAPVTSALAIALCSTSPAMADEAEPAGAIVVTGQGLDEGDAQTAYDVITLERDAIASSASGRIEDALSTVAGFQQFRRSDSRSANPSAQGVTLRALGGNASSRAIVLLDGVPVANPFFGYIPLSALAPERLSSIRVTRGGGMGAFGTGAVSGTIELNSAGPAEVGRLNASALVDQRGETQLSATTAHALGLGTDAGFIVASVQWDKGQGFWTTPRDQRVDASARAAYKSWSASLRAVAPLTDSVEVQASGLVYGDSRTLRFKGADSTSDGQQASLRFIGRGEWKFDVLGYVQAQDFSNVVISSTRFTKTLDQAKTPTLAIGAKAEVRPPVGGGHVLRLGADIRKASGNLVEMPFTAGRATAFRRAGGDQSDLGLYVQDDWTLGNVVVTASGRADRWTIRNGYYRELAASGTVNRDMQFADRSDWAGNGRLGVAWTAAPGVTLRAAGYSGLRLPTLNELYRPYVVFPVETRANAALRPERLRGYEAGVDFAPHEGVSLALTAFDNRLKDAIANVTIGANLLERQNVASIRARGIEASARIAMGTVTFDGSLSWTDAKVNQPGTDLEGMRPSQVPRLDASATLAWAPREGWRLAATVRHVGKQFEDDQGTFALPAATTLDAFARIPVAGPLALILRGENLTDDTIVTRNQAGSMDLGTPRTLWAGVAVQFN